MSWLTDLGLTVIETPQITDGKIYFGKVDLDLPSTDFDLNRILAAKAGAIYGVLREERPAKLQAADE